MKNVYEAEGNLQFTAAKTMEGRPLEEGEFTFRIYEGDTLKAEAQNGAGGVILFRRLTTKPTMQADIPTQSWNRRVH